MISPRYLPAMCVLLAIALVPTLIHSYSGRVFDDGRRTASIPTVLAGYRSAPTERNSGWGKRRFDSDDWMEREYRATTGSPLTLTVVRSYDAKSLYHHPELAVAYGRSTFTREEVRRADGRSDIPIRVLTGAREVPAVAAYALHYDTRFIDNPFVFQIRSAGELLVSRRKPMTLFFVLDEAGTSAKDPERSPAATLLLAAVDAFLAQPPAPR